jgi:hypothetical protein
MQATRREAMDAEVADIERLSRDRKTRPEAQRQAWDLLKVWRECAPRLWAVFSLPK